MTTVETAQAQCENAPAPRTGGYAEELKKHLLPTANGGGLLQEKTLSQGLIAKVILMLLEDPEISLDRIAITLRVPAVYLRGHIRTPLFKAAFNAAQKEWQRQKEAEGVPVRVSDLTEFLAYHEGASPQDLARTLQAQILAKLSQHVQVEADPNKLTAILAEISKVVPVAAGGAAPAIQNNIFTGSAVDPEILASAREAAMKQVLVARPPRLEKPDESAPCVD